MVLLCGNGYMWEVFSVEVKIVDTHYMLGYTSNCPIVKMLD
jgi:hypothetical protein